MVPNEGEEDSPRISPVESGFLSFYLALRKPDSTGDTRGEFGTLLWDLRDLHLCLEYGSLKPFPLGGGSQRDHWC